MTKKPKPRIEVFACPYCGGTRNLVVDTRGFTHQDGIRRRRKCLICGQRWTTIEVRHERPTKAEPSRDPKPAGDREQPPIRTGRPPVLWVTVYARGR